MKGDVGEEQDEQRARDVVDAPTTKEIFVVAPKRRARLPQVLGGGQLGEGEPVAAVVFILAGVGAIAGEGSEGEEAVTKVDGEHNGGGGGAYWKRMRDGERASGATVGSKARNDAAFDGEVSVGRKKRSISQKRRND